MNDLPIEDVPEVLERADSAFLTIGYLEPVPALGDVDEENREYEETVESYEITGLED